MGDCPLLVSGKVELKVAIGDTKKYKKILVFLIYIFYETWTQIIPFFEAYLTHASK